MRCPVCGSKLVSVLKTVAKRESFRRRRVCASCLSRWTTAELVVGGVSRIVEGALVPPIFRES